MISKLIQKITVNATISSCMLAVNSNDFNIFMWNQYKQLWSKQDNLLLFKKQ